MPKNRWEVWLAGLLLAVAVLLVGLGLRVLSCPDPNGVSLYLGPAAGERNGWTFETADGPAEPEFGFDGCFAGIPAEKGSPVAASRVMDALDERTLLEFSYSGMGIQVFLDGDLLFTDFPNQENRVDEFLTDADWTGLGRSGLRVPLPVDCAGKTLRVVCYGDITDGLLPVGFPSLVSPFSDAYILTAESVMDMAELTTLSLLSVFLLLMLLLESRGGRLHWSFPPLAAYFMLATVPLLQGSFLIEATEVGRREAFSRWSDLAYMDFLLMFLALEMKGWRRWVLLGASVLHAVTCIVQAARSADVYSGGGPVELALLILAAVLLLLSWKEKAVFRWVSVGLLAASGVMFAAYGVTRFWGREYLYPLSNPVSALLRGSPRAFYTVLCAVTGGVSAVWVVVDFVRGTLERHRQVLALAENHRLTLENYRAAEKKLRQNAVMRHEWKNQVAALHLLQQQGDLEGLERRLAELDHQLDRLAPRQYTENLVINTILQNAAARAEELGAAFHAIALAPAELGIETDDLCSLLLNLLDNALEAVSSVPGEGAVECSIKVQQGYLAIRCENTYAGPLALDKDGQLQTTKADRDGHGFGLEQMRAVAKRHGSMLDISHTEDRFIVQTALKIR